MVARDLVAVVLAALVVAVLGLHPSTLAGVCLAAVTPELARVDLREHRLPNRMTVPGIVVGLVASGLGVALSATPGTGLAGAVLGATRGDALVPLVAALAFGGALGVMALAGGIGMGDAKLAAFIGLASPAPGIALAAPVLAFLIGGVAALVVLVRAGRGARIPFGPALLAGYWAAVALAGLGSGWTGLP
ncbi:MAG: prepilin peptidase [Microbacteriaceae bacterium]|nr:prepilin peptidase [Microbacteriaceae bacterium]